MGSGGSLPLHGTAIAIGLLFGFLSRFLSLRVDFRQYPATPAGYTSHLTMGFIAAFIGAVFTPALVAKQFTAATFLTLAAQQFYQIRQMERKSLEQVESMSLVRRGPSYIEGIARTFEERNYLTMAVALVSSTAAVFAGPAVGGILGLGAAWGSQHLKRGKVLGDIARLYPGKLWFERTLFYVDDVMMMEVGLRHPRERFLREGLGVVIEAKDAHAQAVIWDLAQRQAIAHEAAAAVGAQTDVGYPEAVPLVRMALPQNNGRAALFILPVERNLERLLEAVAATPVLESSKGGRMVTRVVKRGRSVAEGGGEK